MHCPPFKHLKCSHPGKQKVVSKQRYKLLSMIQDAMIISINFDTLHYIPFLNDNAPVSRMFKGSLQPMHHSPHIPDIATQFWSSAHFS